MNNNDGLLTEDAVLKLILEEFGTESEQEFDSDIPGLDNGVLIC
nr:hypothetical protein [uncultured Blautia sp.]